MRIKYEDVSTFEALQVALTVVFVIFAVVGGIVSCANKIDHSSQDREWRKLQQHCVHTGYIGKYEEKVYKCDTRPVVREGDI